MGASWWQLGLLKDSDSLCLRDLIALTGLIHLCVDIQLGKAGMFCLMALFIAQGAPFWTSEAGAASLRLSVPQPPPPTLAHNLASPGTALWGTVLFC